MAKDKSLKKYDQLIDLDFVEDRTSPGDEALAGMMNGFIEASNHQQKMAIELTKLVVEKSPENINEEHIFSAFKRAIKVVAEHYPLKELWEKFS